jgi:hypothetical protein
VALARQARADWAAELDRLDDHPFLARDIDPETELIELTRQPVNDASLPAQGGSDGGHAGPDAIDRLVMLHCVRRHMLPRFMLPRSFALVWSALSAPARWLAAAAVALMAAVAVALVAGGLGRLGDQYTLAATLAALAYAAIVLAAVADRPASWPFLLRQPASAAVGMLTLATFSSWWTSAADSNTQASWQAVGALVVFGYGYLVIEARNHGVGRPLWWRPAVVLAAGLGHAFLVSLIALRWVIPAFADNTLVGWWHDGCKPGQVLPAPTLLAVATAWSFAVGVFAQILWDDRPITAPLAHVEWRGGR